MNNFVGVLQFVPNFEIANNFLKNEFCLKDILSYKQEDFKSDKGENVKYDKLEGKILFNSIIKKTCFISCFTMLNEDFFEEKWPYNLKDEVIKNLEKGNVDVYGQKIERPFITINEKFNKLNLEIKEMVESFFRENNIKLGQFYGNKVKYLNLSDYIKEGGKEERFVLSKNPSKNDINRIDIADLDTKEREELKLALEFMYITKLEKYRVQNEYRIMVKSDDPFSNKFLNNDLLKIPIKENLHGYVKVHKHDDIYNLTKNDL